MTYNEFIARTCHEVNRAYCESIGDTTQVPWGDAEPWQRDSAVRGVEYAFANPDVTPEQQHEAWSQDKLAAGWVYGPVKDTEQKTHPCLVSYADLPKEQQVKDHLFRAVVQALCSVDFTQP